MRAGAVCAALLFFASRAVAVAYQPDDDLYNALVRLPVGAPDRKTGLSEVAVLPKSAFRIGETVEILFKIENTSADARSASHLPSDVLLSRGNTVVSPADCGFIARENPGFFESAIVERIPTGYYKISRMLLEPIPDRELPGVYHVQIRSKIIDRYDTRNVIGTMLSPVLEFTVLPADPAGEATATDGVR